MNKNNNNNNRKRRFLVKTPLKYIHSEKCQQKACKKLSIWSHSQVNGQRYQGCTYTYLIRNNNSNLKF